MALPPYTSLPGRLWHYGFNGYCALVLLFLIVPILIIVPLSFNAEPYFTFTSGMLALDPEAFSMRWYQSIIDDPLWIASIKNSIIVAVFSTLISTALGTMAAVGLSRSQMPYKSLIMGILISPMVVPLIISAAGMYFFYTQLGLSQTYTGIILAHAILGIPFVVITVTSTLVGFDHSLTRAAASLGAPPTTTFFKVTMPLIRPGVISGGLFAFATSFDEVVVVLFLTSIEQRTVPRQMWSGVREQISPTILAVATLLIVSSVILLVTLELLRRRNARMRGIQE